MKSARALTLVGLALLLSPPPAPAQLLPAGMGIGHGLRREPVARGLHARLVEADAAATATVSEVSLGRIQVRDAAAIFGDLPDAFALKRAPSNPPPLAAGDRVLLLLRGARSPYLLVDRPDEVRVLAGTEAEGRWRGAVLKVRSLRARPRELASLYVHWLGAVDAELRRAAIAGLRDAQAPFQPLRAEALAALAQLAMDPGASNEARRGAAAIASVPREGRLLLLARLPGSSETANREVLLVAMRAAALARDPELHGVVLRGLRHPGVEIRRTALQFAGLARTDPALRQELRRIADHETDPELRATAQRMLHETAAAPTAVE